MVPHELRDAIYVCLRLLETALHSFPQTRVVGCLATDMLRRHACAVCVLLDLRDEFMKSHAQGCATRHYLGQVPHDHLKRIGTGAINPATQEPEMFGMDSFRKALIWHMDQRGTSIHELARGAGVSSDIIKKLRTRENASTNAETASKIAAFYGKDVASFIALRDVSADQQFIALLGLLNRDERNMIERQLRALAGDRAAQERDE